jgi:hypothetical protein
VTTDPSAQPEDRETAELDRLRVRVDQLERELAERTASAEAAVAAAQERSYWADRLPFDLNAVMPTPLGRAAYLFLKALARVVRAAKGRLS